MELEEAKENFSFFNEGDYITKEMVGSKEVIIQALENSIPKQVIEEYLNKEQEAFNTYKKESKSNENLKMGMWKHLGAKNMCEKILGIEKSIVTLDEEVLEMK